MCEYLLQSSTVFGPSREPCGTNQVKLSRYAGTLCTDTEARVLRTQRWHHTLYEVSEACTDSSFAGARCPIADRCPDDVSVSRWRRHSAKCACNAGCAGQAEGADARRWHPGAVCER